MTSYAIKYIAVLLLLLCTCTIYSQQKYEKERRMSPNDVPDVALDFIKTLESNKKVKWYLEEGIEKNSIEAKFKRNGQRLSVEFDTSGNLEDIEINIKWKTLEPNLQSAIKAHLEKKCARYKISKIQIQYTGDPAILSSVVKGSQQSVEYYTKYEVVASCKEDNIFNQYEYLFDEDGNLINTLQIILNKSSNLEY